MAHELGPEVTGKREGFVLKRNGAEVIIRK